MYIALVVGFVFGVVDDEVIITSLNESTKVQNPRRNSIALCIYCACAYECLAAPSRPSPVSRLFYAGCTSS